MTLERQTYLDHLAADSTRFADVLKHCDPSISVPSCPDWNATDLLWHLATVQRWWAEVVTARPTRPEEIDLPLPDSPDARREAFVKWSEMLASALTGADPSHAAWNWSDDQTVGFILRRQAHEALIHRVDAELTAGQYSHLDPTLAADGVDEVLKVMYGGCPPWGSWAASEADLIRVDLTDTGHEFWLQLGTFAGTDPDDGTTYADEDDFHVVDPAPGQEPGLVIDGPAAAMDLWLWHRGDDSQISSAGDQCLLDTFRRVVAQPIN